MVYCRSDRVLLEDAISKFQKDPVKTYGLDLLYFVSLSGYTYGCVLYESKQEVEYIHDEDIF